jgi:hypothetical protein
MEIIGDHHFSCTIRSSLAKQLPIWGMLTARCSAQSTTSRSERPTTFFDTNDLIDPATGQLGSADFRRAFIAANQFPNMLTVEFRWLTWRS